MLGSRVRDGREEFCVASEDCAFGPIGFQRVRDVAPGEMLIITGAQRRGPHAAPVLASAAARRRIGQAICVRSPAGRPETDMLQAYPAHCHMHVCQPCMHLQLSQAASVGGWRLKRLCYACRAGEARHQAVRPGADQPLHLRVHLPGAAGLGAERHPCLQLPDGPGHPPGRAHQVSPRLAPRLVHRCCARVLSPLTCYWSELSNRACHDADG